MSDMQGQETKASHVDFPMPWFHPKGREKEERRERYHQILIIAPWMGVYYTPTHGAIIRMEL